MIEGMADKGNRVRVGYKPDGIPFLAVAWDIAPVVKTYSIALDEDGVLGFRLHFKDDSTSDFRPGMAGQVKMYESPPKDMEFQVGVSLDVGEMSESGIQKEMCFQGEPFKVELTPQQLSGIESGFSVFKVKH